MVKIGVAQSEKDLGELSQKIQATEPLDSAINNEEMLYYRDDVTSDLWCKWKKGDGTVVKKNMSASGGGANHNLLDGSTHPDTLAGTVVRGDIVVGNLTPKWARKALGLSGQYLRSDGTDLLYSSILAGDLPASVILDTETNVIIDAMIAAHTSTKITITAKGQLNSALLYNDQNNNLGAFYEDLAQIVAPVNPAAGTRRLFVDSADGKLKVRTSAGSNVSLEEQGGAGTPRESLVGHWSQSMTKTNIGTSFVDIYNQANADGKSVSIDTNGKTDLRLTVNWNKVGAGTQTVQVIDVVGSVVLVSMNVVSGYNDSGLIAIPASLLNTVKRYKLQGKSTTSTDDPIFEGATICLK